MEMDVNEGDKCEGDGWTLNRYIGKVPLIRPTELFGEDGKENERNVEKVNSSG